MSPERRYNKGKVARERIIRTTIEVFAKYGISSASFQMIADRIGVSQAAIFHHFPSKHILIEETLSAIVASNREIVSSATQVEDGALMRLRSYGECNLQWAMTRKKEAQVIVMVYYLATVEKRFAAIYAAIKANAQSRILEILHAGKRENTFLFDGDIQERCELLHATVIGLMINSISTESPRVLPKLNREWLMVVQALTQVDQGSRSERGRGPSKS